MSDAQNQWSNADPLGETQQAGRDKRGSVRLSSAGRTDCIKNIPSSWVDLTLGRDPAPHHRLWLSPFLKIQEDAFSLMSPEV